MKIPFAAVRSNPLSKMQPNYSQGKVGGPKNNQFSRLAKEVNSLSEKLLKNMNGGFKFMSKGSAKVADKKAPADFPDFSHFFKTFYGVDFNPGSKPSSKQSAYDYWGQNSWNTEDSSFFSSNTQNSQQSSHASSSSTSHSQANKPATHNQYDYWGQSSWNWDDPNFFTQNTQSSHTSSSQSSTPNAHTYGTQANQSSQPSSHNEYDYWGKGDWNWDNQNFFTQNTQGNQWAGGASSTSSTNTTASLNQQVDSTINTFSQITSKYKMTDKTSKAMDDLRASAHNLSQAKTPAGIDAAKADFAKTLTKTFRQLSLAVHPEKNPNNVAASTKDFQDLLNARDNLLKMLDAAQKSG